jgi:Transposase DDE domain
VAGHSLQEQPGGKSSHVRRDAESGSQLRAPAATLRGVAGGCRARNLVERFFNMIEPCRRVATRYDKLAANYLAFIKLASIRIWLGANGSTR